MARQGMGWFLLGLLAGSAVGVALRLMVQAAGDGERSAGEEGAAPRTSNLDHLRERALAGPALARGREAARAARTAAGKAPVVPAHMGEPVQRLVSDLRARWREALTEGRQAAAEKEAALRRRYLELVGRPAPGRSRR